MTLPEQSYSPEARVGKRAEQKRKWDSEHRYKPCPRCGAPRSRDKQMCLRCRTAERRRLQPLIERLWAEGQTIREIRAATGVSAFTPGPYRKDGWNLPYRYRVNGRRSRRSNAPIHLQAGH